MSTSSSDRSEAQVGTAKPESAPADLTAIPGVGAKTADVLCDAGYSTFQDLRQADDHALKALVGAYTLAKIREYLYIHFT